MIQIELKTIIERPVEEVFDRLTDLSGYNNWMSKSGLFKNSRKTSTGPVGKGTTFSDKVRYGKAEGEITFYQRPTHVKFRQVVKLMGVSFMESRPEYKLEFLHNHTRIHHIAKGEIYGIFKILEPLFYPVARAERKRTLKALKRSFKNQLTT